MAHRCPWSRGLPSTLRRVRHVDALSTHPPICASLCAARARAPAAFGAAPGFPKMWPARRALPPRRRPGSHRTAFFLFPQQQNQATPVYQMLQQQADAGVNLVQVFQQRISHRKWSIRDPSEWTQLDVEAWFESWQVRPNLDVVKVRHNACRRDRCNARCAWQRMGRFASRSSRSGSAPPLRRPAAAQRGPAAGHARAEGRECYHDRRRRPDRPAQEVRW